MLIRSDLQLIIIAQYPINNLRVHIIGHHRNYSQLLWILLDIFCITLEYMIKQIHSMYKLLISNQNLVINLLEILKYQDHFFITVLFFKFYLIIHPFFFVFRFCHYLIINDINNYLRDNSLINFNFQQYLFIFPLIFSKILYVTIKPIPIDHLRSLTIQ